MNEFIFTFLVDLPTVSESSFKKQLPEVFCKKRCEFRKIHNKTAMLETHFKAWIQHLKEVSQTD